MKRKTVVNKETNSLNTLTELLANLNGKQYGSYQELIGRYHFSNFSLNIISIPKDPFATPGSGLFRIKVDYSDANFPPALYSTARRKIALRDYLAIH